MRSAKPLSGGAVQAGETGPLPSLAAGVRRLHDTNRSAWFLLLVLIPIAGPIIYLVFLAQEGTPGENQYGSNPKMGVM